MLRFGVIGTGWISDAYIEGALDSGLWELTAVYSRSIDRGLEFGKKYGVENIYTDIDKFASAEEIDAVYIASPNYIHAEQCKLFLNNHKHVICEKPVASHAAEVKELQNLAEAKGIIYMEAIMYMHLPMRRLLDDAIKKIGKITMAKFDFCQRSSKYDRYLNGELPNIFNPKMETGALMDLGIYCVYPAVYLFGRPESLSIDVTMLDSGVDGSGVISFKYPDKLVNITYSKTGQAGANSDIQGDYGTIYIESISKLANIEISYSDGRKESVCGEEEKYKLMGYEAIDFYKFITDPAGTVDEYKLCRDLSLTVADILEKLRSKAGIKFPSDN